MTPNLPQAITVNKNLASTLKAFIKENSGKTINENQLNEILQRVAIFDAERDNGTRPGNSIFEGGAKYFGGDENNFKVKHGQQIQLSVEEYNAIFEGYIDPIKIEEKAKDQPANLKQPPPAVIKEQHSVLPKPEANPDSKLTRPKTADMNANANNNAQLDKDVKTIFPDGLPEGITASYTNIDGTNVLIFKKDGQTLDQTQLRQLTYAQKSEPADQTKTNSPESLSSADTPEAELPNNPAEENYTPKTQKHAEGNSPDILTKPDTPEAKLPNNPAEENYTPKTQKHAEGNSPDTLTKPDTPEAKLPNNPAEENYTPKTQKHAEGNSPDTLTKPDTPEAELPNNPAKKMNIPVDKESPSTRSKTFSNTTSDKPTQKQEAATRNTYSNGTFGIGNISRPFEQQTLDMLYYNTSVHTNFLKNANQLLGTVEYKNQNELTESEKQKTQAGIIGRYGTSNHQWCAHTVSTIAERSGINIDGHKAQVQQFINWGKAQGIYNPISNKTINSTNFESVRESRASEISNQIAGMKEGDLIIWKSKYAAKTNEGLNFWNASHIGIIESADPVNGTVTVIEGNANIARSDNTYERYIVRNSAQGKIGDQVIGEPEELNRTDGLIRKIYTIQELANFGYSGYINMQDLV